MRARNKTKNATVFIMSVLLVGLGSIFSIQGSAEAAMKPSPSQLNSPKKITFTYIGSTSLSFKWDSVANNNGYTVRVYDAAGKNTVLTSPVGSNTENFTTPNSLNASTSYRVSVQALPKNGYSLSAESGKFSVTTVTYALAKTISTSSQLDYGNVDPAVSVNGLDFKSTITKTDFEVSSGDTTLTLDSVLWINANQITLNFKGTSAAGSIDIIAKASAFTIAPLANSNQITIVASNVICESTGIRNIGGDCQIGDIGPAGGTIYFISNLGFKCGPEFTNTGSPTSGLCHYLEVAPSTWYDGISDPLLKWNPNVDPDPNNPTVPTVALIKVDGIVEDEALDLLTIGNGYLKTMQARSQTYTYMSSSLAVTSYRGGEKADWYLPSSGELNLLCLWARNLTPQVSSQCADGGTLTKGNFHAGDYSSSSEISYAIAYDQYFDGIGYNSGEAFTPSLFKFLDGYVPPIRSF